MEESRYWLGFNLVPRIGPMRVRALLEGSVGLASLAGAILLGLGHERRGVGMAVAGLIIDLTVVNLLVFYQDQAKALITTFLQYVVLAALFSYRRIYLEPEGDEAMIMLADAMSDSVVAEQPPLVAETL